MEKYSVLMSVYEKENPFYLKQSIESMINQTIKPNQIVLVEDGFLTNKLEEVINYYEKIYPNVFDVIRRKENLGLGYSLNEGLRICKNDLVARMDTDDISKSDRCEKQLKRFSENPNLCVLGGQINEFYENVDNILYQRKVPTEYEQIKKFSRRRSPFNHPTVMYKKSIILGVGGYPEVKRKEDLELFLKIVFDGYYCENLKDVLLFYRSSKSNLKRRKSFINCIEYIQIMYNFLKLNKIGLNDFIYVVLGQLALYFLPSSICSKLSNNLLRDKVS